MASGEWVCPARSRDRLSDLPLTSEGHLIVKAIQKNDFLSRLDDEQTAMMVDLLAVSNFKPGEDVITEGSEGDSMYIVAGEVAPRGLVGPRADGGGGGLLEQPSFCVGGELRVTQAGRNLRTLTTGDVFGELAILYNCKRTATVTGLPPQGQLQARQRR